MLSLFFSLFFKQHYFFIFCNNIYNMVSFFIYQDHTENYREWMGSTKSTYNSSKNEKCKSMYEFSMASADAMRH